MNAPLHGLSLEEVSHRQPSHISTNSTGTSTVSHNHVRTPDATARNESRGPTPPTQADEELEVNKLFQMLMNH
jgi:hypothetical protein